MTNESHSVEQSLVWRNLEAPGRERFSLISKPDGWCLKGNVSFEIAGREHAVDYRIECDARWRTRLVYARQSVGSESRHVTLTSDGEGHWLRDGQLVSNVSGCIDADLSITPATNTLPIRRLNLAIGEHQRVNAAWLRFPELTLQVLLQTYTRLSNDRYRYESDTGFSTELTVDELGLVVNYPLGWERVPDAH